MLIQYACRYCRTVLSVGFGEHASDDATMTDHVLEQLILIGQFTDNVKCLALKRNLKGGYFTQYVQ